jgi:methylglutaconyl-CoA hydratase
MKPPSVAQIASRAKDVTKIASRAQPAPASAQAVVFSNPVKVNHCGHVKIIHLNRPSAHNAISLELLAGLRREIESISRETDRERGTRAVIVASNDDEHFCVGADLKERRGFTLEE